MSDEPPRVVPIPIPETRHSVPYQKSSWSYRRLHALSKLKPDKECLEVYVREASTKKEIVRLHSLARRYGFKVACRGVGDSTVLVWVRKPGIRKEILNLWGDQ